MGEWNGSHINFFDGLSKKLLKHPDSRAYPDITSFGFFCRRANIKQLKKPYEDNASQWLGRGLSFHIAPSNVPINFAYSLFVGLISGNACIVRSSSKDFIQTRIVSDAIAQVLDEDKFIDLKARISIIKYEHNAIINDYFSGLCDVRIIWGGDQSIAEIRQSPLAARAYDITFADRYSLCVISAGDYLQISDKHKIALGFYNDTYLFDQNACSSPRLIYWLGSETEIAEAKAIFWHYVQVMLDEKKYKTTAISSINKYYTACSAAIDYQDVQIIQTQDNRISRIQLSALPDDLPEHVCAGGSFFEYSDTSLDKLCDVITRKFQTLVYIGLEKNEIVELFLNKGVLGVDRIVPCGKATDFGLVWDGYDLIRQMSRIISMA
ncbi:acyl-CoA reductase [sulfur-oxidizing endosymbiont of Gigantopelta aegis]|uniref:acyl-CoA reductase n=1 Tax=sulfur-oxidizing endosymbiont of Gigantopelta aegis TaxID=2794934 RepID=UPI0018DC1D40|nr:acyl-CoA reductase [sulfur-oxidizing endosymbiont of Gigantopelta aegis]